MTNTTINGQIEIMIPEGFHVMDAGELKQLYRDDNTDRFGIWDKDRHIIISVFWHESGKMLSMLADPKSVAKGDELKMRKGLKNSGYACTGFFEKELCGKKTYGYGCEYDIGEIRQIAEAVILKKDNICYKFYYYARKNGPDTDHELFESVLDSVKIL